MCFGRENRPSHDQDQAGVVAIAPLQPIIGVACVVDFWVSGQPSRERTASESVSDVHVVSECLDVGCDCAAGHVRHIADDVQDLSAANIY